MAFSRSQTHAEFIGAITPTRVRVARLRIRAVMRHVLSQGFSYFRLVQLFGGHHLPGQVVCPDE